LPALLLSSYSIWSLTQTSDLTVEIINSPIPVPNADQVLIKVVVSGSNPKDWKVPEGFKRPHNSGDDISGIVEKVGENVTEFKAGDRVAAFRTCYDS
jgi:NADPH2:quinone reductase